MKVEHYFENLSGSADVDKRNLLVKYLLSVASPENVTAGAAYYLQGWNELKLQGRLFISLPPQIAAGDLQFVWER